MPTSNFNKKFVSTNITCQLLNYTVSLYYLVAFVHKLYVSPLRIDQIHQQELTETRTKRQVCISKYRNKDNHCDIYLMNFNYCVLMIKLMYIVTIIYLISILD